MPFPDQHRPLLHSLCSDTQCFREDICTRSSASYVVFQYGQPPKGEQQAQATPRYPRCMAGKGPSSSLGSLRFLQKISGDTTLKKGLPAAKEGRHCSLFMSERKGSCGKTGVLSLHLDLPTVTLSTARHVLKAGRRNGRFGDGEQAWALETCVGHQAGRLPGYSAGTGSSPLTKTNRKHGIQGCWPGRGGGHRNTVLWPNQG